jgi:hypothetical protein
LDHAARRNHRQNRATLSSAVNERCQNADSACIEVSHARKIERHVRRRGLVQLRRPERFVCTVPKDQASACAHDEALCLADGRQRKLTPFAPSALGRLPMC